ncbi:MAG: hypothetical protein KAG84_00760 [Bacteroidales bacterium]|nr:hypothetical protein [Bacteroidales bacterium]
MKNLAIIIGLAASFALGFYINSISNSKLEKISAKEVINNSTDTNNDDNLKLGAFSLSLSVKDIKASKLFYENLGFVQLGGNVDMKYLIMKNENSLIGLFQGMFDGNILTFNPGWNESGENIDYFDDIRIIQDHLKSNGVSILKEINKETSGPASFMIMDPDSNTILIDQHR